MKERFRSKSICTVFPFKRMEIWYCFRSSCRQEMSLNINPTLVLDAFGVQTGMLIDRLAVQKTAVLTKDGKNFA